MDGTTTDVDNVSYYHQAHSIFYHFTYNKTKIVKLNEISSNRKMYLSIYFESDHEVMQLFHIDIVQYTKHLVYI